ncbi:DUF1080 domain-containing protein [Aliifodinibius sp. S!AR15-10]|uniref:3-keto-disaccharide hydrolase n=1 Tax=Aliifodinibius sp. S!AR15-10 TaxID=2950437 RepID=UPI0028608ACA|nr:DUF1080 domain-containing protein [Aliifodinibius sp. S!AR15-10]MDR8390136.1 DUF1080 domain-containing protein [Aliifodinibius sp. S!AR15-10]
MKLFNITVLGVILLLTGIAHYQDSPSESETGEWIPIFNGENLEGWTPKFAGHKLGVNYKNTFRVEDELLKASYENYDQFNGAFGHLYYKTPYSHYKIRAEYRFVGEQVPGAPEWAWRNSGLKLHSQPPETMGLDQMSPVSIEVQLLGGNGTDKRTTANMCSMGTHVVMDGELITQHCVNSQSDTYHGDQWVTVVAEVRGGELFRHFVNGEEVLSYSDLQYDTEDPNAQKLIKEGQENLLIDNGYISLQAESHPVHFRSVEILPLDK